MSDINKAKQLYFEFYGNEFFMWKDGFLEEYKSYNIRQKQELIWRNELREKLYSQLEIKHESSFNGLHILINYFGDYDLLERVLDYISINYKEADSFLKLRYAEDFFDILEKCKFHKHCPEKSMIETSELVTVLIQDILGNKIIINDESEKILEFNKDVPHEEYVIVRAESLLDRLKL